MVLHLHVQSQRYIYAGAVRKSVALFLNSDVFING